jgi:hypothetical protein
VLPGFQKGRPGISRLLKEKGREQFWPKIGQFESCKEKWDRISLLFRVNKIFFHKFEHIYDTLDGSLALPGGAGIINYQYLVNKIKTIFFKGQDIRHMTAFCKNSECFHKNLGFAVNQI